MKNKKNSKSKKLAILPVFAMLLTGIVSITGVTYAWFSSGDNATVSDIDLKVKTADGILASWTGKDGTWKSTLSLDECTGEGSFKVVPVKEVAEVSTVNAVTNGFPSFYTAMLGTDGDTLTAEAQPTVKDNANADIDYVIFDIYFKVDRDTYLFLGANSAVESYDMVPSTAEGAAEGEKERKDTDTEKAARVGFIDQGSSLYNKEAADGQQIQAFRNGNNMVIWEPHETEHISASGVAEATKLDYKGVNAAGEFKISEADETKLKPVTTYTKEQLSAPTNVNPDEVSSYEGLSLVHLEKGYNKVTVCVWLEGQDADCLNDISGSTLHSTIDFVRYTAE